MVPDELVEELTWACHESLVHAGPYKCFLALHEDFIWINMLRKIKSLLRTCHLCQTAKYPNLHTCVEMGNIVTRNKNELLCTDFLGPLPRATRGLKNLVVVTDAFTKYVSLYPVGRPTTNAVLKVILDKYVPKHGQIKKLLSDQGKQFTNKRWSGKLEKNNIKAILTAIRR
ncbi:MAG: integrase, partial [Wolbachia sp.]